MDSWLPNELTVDSVLVAMTSSSLEYDIDKTRAFVVALLTDVNDHNAAAKVNDVLLGSE
jgi:hypothetical protein